MKNNAFRKACISKIPISNLPDTTKKVFNQLTNFLVILWIKLNKPNSKAILKYHPITIILAKIFHHLSNIPPYDYNKYFVSVVKRQHMKNISKKKL